MDRPRLVPYIRQSRRRERTISLEEQRRTIQQWACAHDVDLASEIVEAGVSGNRPWRTRELGAAIEACERGEAAGIVVAWQDRLSRESARATAEVWEALEAAGARLVCAAEGLDTSTGDHELLFTIKAAIAREQWKRFRANWDNARRNAVERGQHPSGHVPFGYARRKDRRLVPDPSTAHLVESTFRRRAEGASWAELVDFLQASGVRPRRGTRWCMRAVTGMIKNRVYLGEAYSGEFRNPDAHEPLVTRAIWTAAQSKQPGRVTRGTDGARLSGLVFCATCGGRLTAGPDYYRCLNSRRNAFRDPCGRRAHALKRALDELVVGAFLARYEASVGSLDDEPEPPETGDLRRRLRHAQDALQSLVDDPLSLAALTSKKRAELLSNASEEVEAAQADLDAVEVRHATSVVNVWRLGDYFEGDGFRELRIPDQRRLLTAGIERIVVQPVRERPDWPMRPLDARVTIEWADESADESADTRASAA